MSKSDNVPMMYEVFPAVAALNQVQGFNPLKMLRRMVSLDEQREALRLLSKVPNDAIKGYTPELAKFLSRGE